MQLETSIYSKCIKLAQTRPLFQHRFGRRNTMIVCTSVGFFAKLGCAFVHDYWLFVVCRFIIAFCGGGMYLSIFVYSKLAFVCTSGHTR